MDIFGFLPPSSSLNASAFKRWNDDENSLRANLAISHSLQSVLGGHGVEGHSDITYVIQGFKKVDNLSGNLEITNDASYVGTQSPDLIRALMEELRPRTSYSVASVSDGLFDLRGFCYVLGIAAAGGSNNAEFNYDRGLASMKLLSPSWSVPVAGQLTIGPGVAVSSREYVTLAYLAYAGGIRSLQLMADLLPDRTARPLQGTELAGFALKLANNVFSVAQSCAACGHHMQAFFRGMTYAWSLWSHSDEGGWIRRALNSPSYPPGAGIVAVTTEEFMSLPLRKRIDPLDVTRLCVGLYLTFAGVTVVADCEESGLPTVFERDGDGDPRPSHFEGLHYRTYEVMGRWRRLIADRFDLHHGAVGDQHSFRNYFVADRVDRHLDNKSIIPFWWVEPSPLVSGDTGKLFMPASRGKVVSMKFTNCEELICPDMSPHRNGTYPRGTEVTLIFGPGGLRERGYSYLLSGAYRRENGLGFAEYVTEPTEGVHTTDAMFVDPNETNASDRRWVTPHNPMPNPIEGFMSTHSAICYTYAGIGNDPGLDEWVGGTVDSLLGFFRLVDTVPQPVTKTHHHVPKHLDRFTRWAAQRVSDPTRRIKYNSHTPIKPKVHAPEPEALLLKPPSSSQISLPKEEAPPKPPEQSEKLTVPLAADVGVKPAIRTDAGGETKNPGASA